MEKKNQYTLGLNEKLKSRKAIEELFVKGKSFSNFPFKIIYVHTVSVFNLQAAFSVSKRYFKKAVDRNKIKRLMREGYRLQKPALKNELEKLNHGFTVFILYTGKEIPEYELVSGKMGAIIKRLQKITNEEIIANT